MVSKIEMRVTDEMNRQLDMVFLRANIDTALSQMSHDKAPGPDVFNVAFYKDH